MQLNRAQGVLRYRAPLLKDHADKLGTLFGLLGIDAVIFDEELSERLCVTLTDVREDD